GDIRRAGRGGDWALTSAEAGGGRRLHTFPTHRRVVRGDRADARAVFCPFWSTRPYVKCDRIGGWRLELVSSGRTWPRAELSSGLTAVIRFFQRLSQFRS